MFIYSLSLTNSAQKNLKYISTKRFLESHGYHDLKACTFCYHTIILILNFIMINNEIAYLSIIRRYSPLQVAFNNLTTVVYHAHMYFVIRLDFISTTLCVCTITQSSCL